MSLTLVTATPIAQPSQWCTKMILGTWGAPLKIGGSGGSSPSDNHSGGGAPASSRHVYFLHIASISAQQFMPSWCKAQFNPILFYLLISDCHLYLPLAHNKWLNSLSCLPSGADLANFKGGGPSIRGTK